MPSIPAVARAAAALLLELLAPPVGVPLVVGAPATTPLPVAVLVPELEAVETGVGVAVERIVVVVSLERVAIVSRTPPAGPPGGGGKEVALRAAAARENCVMFRLRVAVGFS